ncbi:hypothetical protein [Streptomyces sp. NPDC048057]|uniref:hypothetical protein n=1 Tax=Streptomyces sp. NPDC048057 TaxID=3155628 RepID=UPI0033E6DFBC
MSNDIDLDFALQVAGAELSDKSPAPDSPLGRLRQFVADNDIERLTQDHVAQALSGKL